MVKKENRSRVQDVAIQDYIPESPKPVICKRIRRRSLQCSADVYSFLSRYRRKTQEHFLVILLNAKNNVIKYKAIFVGTLDASIFHPREIFRFAVINNSSKIIIAHNHPSGSLDPSFNDVIMTEKLMKAGELMNIQVVDSVIISEEGYRSIINKELREIM